MAGPKPRGKPHYHRKDKRQKAVVKNGLATPTSTEAPTVDAKDIRQAIEDVTSSLQTIAQAAVAYPHQVPDSPKSEAETDVVPTVIKEPDETPASGELEMIKEEVELEQVKEKVVVEEAKDKVILEESKERAQLEDIEEDSAEDDEDNDDNETVDYAIVSAAALVSSVVEVKLDVAEGLSPIDLFFRSIDPEFEYSTTISSYKQFHRLLQASKWNVEEKRQLRWQFSAAVAQEFELGTVARIEKFGLGRLGGGAYANSLVICKELGWDGKTTLNNIFACKQVCKANPRGASY